MPQIIAWSQDLSLNTSTFQGEFVSQYTSAASLSVYHSYDGVVGRATHFRFLEKVGILSGGRGGIFSNSNFFSSKLSKSSFALELNKYIKYP